MTDTFYVEPTDELHPTYDKDEFGFRIDISSLPLLRRIKIQPTTPTHELPEHIVLDVTESASGDRCGTLDIFSLRDKFNRYFTKKKLHKTITVDDDTYEVFIMHCYDRGDDKIAVFPQGDDEDDFFYFSPNYDKFATRNNEWTKYDELQKATYLHLNYTLFPHF